MRYPYRLFLPSLLRRIVRIVHNIQAILITQIICVVVAWNLVISDANDVFSGTVVCGIGHLTSFFPEQLLENKGEFDVDGIRCYWNDDILLYKEDDTDCDAVYNEWHSVDETIAGNGFEIYPNPSYNVLFVLSENINSEYRITNILGETVASGKIASETQQINVSSLSEGMYFITIGNVAVKFLKK